jgi:hypothetical protein
MRHAFQVAEHKRSTISVGKLVQLLVEQTMGILRLHRIGSIENGSREISRGLRFMPLSPEPHPASLKRDPTGNTVKPGTERISHPESA